MIEAAWRLSCITANSWSVKTIVCLHMKQPFNVSKTFSNVFQKMVIAKWSGLIDEKVSSQYERYLKLLRTPMIKIPLLSDAMGVIYCTQDDWSPRDNLHVFFLTLSPALQIECPPWIFNAYTNYPGGILPILSVFYYTHKSPE